MINHRYFHLMCVACLCLSMAACSTKPLVNKSSSMVVSKNRVVNFNNTPGVMRGLYEQLREWRGVDYKLGGMSKSGVDCSGFVYVTFNDRFGLRLPRTTKTQVKVGPEISENDLKAGDLVFFKTGIFKYHVGIYVEGRRFIHASERVGVTMSSLENPYWSKHYWKSVRLSQ